MKKVKVISEVVRTVIKEVNGIQVGGYVEVKVRVGRNWRLLWFKLEKGELK